MVTVKKSIRSSTATPAKPAVMPATKMRNAGIKMIDAAQVGVKVKKLPRMGPPIPITAEQQRNKGGGAPPNKTRLQRNHEKDGKNFITIFKSVYPGSHFAPLDSITVPALLAAIAATGNITLSCNRLSINRQQVYALRTENEEFRKKMDEAMELGIQGWEDEAARRAFEGFERPIYQQGLHVGSERQYSDTLAVLMLKAARPERYREDKTRIEHTLGGGSVRNTFADKNNDEVNEILNKKLLALGAVSASRGKALDYIDE
jgi:hypothetical protein